MKKTINTVLLLMIIPAVMTAAVSSYDELLSRQQEPYMLHNAEVISFDGHLWTRQYGMNEYYIAPTVNNINSYMKNIKGDRSSSGGFQLVEISLDLNSRTQLQNYRIDIPDNYPAETINVMLPALEVAKLVQQGIDLRLLDFEHDTQSHSNSREDRVVIYEQDFEDDLNTNQYVLDGVIEQPSIIYRNICWGVVDCESYEGENSLWCAADLYADGWYTDPLDPCSSYTNWIWTEFARVEVIDVTVAEDLLFEWWTQYNVDGQGGGDWFRIWVIDANVTEWTMIGEYNGYTPWTDMTFELEDFSNFAYLFEFESNDQDWSSGVYIDNIRVYNMVPNLTWGEESMAEYPYQYSPAEPHNLRVYYEILNDSNADVEESFTTEILISEDQDFTTTDDNYVLETITLTSGLDAGEMETGEIVQNLDVFQTPGGDSLPPGNYYVMFMVDDGEDIDEAFEDDNLWAPNGTFQFGIANLTPGAESSYTFPSQTGTNELEIAAQVTNNGSENTASDFQVGFLISIDNDITTLDDNYELGYLTYESSIASGTSVIQNFNIDLTETDIPAADFWIFFVIDVYATVNESNEYDNTWMSGSQFTYLGPPYLEVEPLILNFTSEPGNQILTVSSNADWTATEDAGWISTDLSAGNGDALVTVEVTENPVNEPRSDLILFEGAGESINITVNQEASIVINYGDIDSSGIVDAYDASLLLQYVVGIPNIDPFPIQVADVDGNDQVAAYDAGIIMQYIVGIIDHFPVEDLRNSNNNDKIKIDHNR